MRLQILSVGIREWVEFNFVDNATGAAIDRPLNHVLEFADIAWPPIGLDSAFRAGRKLGRLVSPKLEIHLSPEVAGQIQNIFLPRSQGRQIQDLEG